MSQSDDTRRAIVAEARSWINTPWQHQGRIKGLGCDCIGLIVGSARVSGLLTPEQEASLPDNYGRYPHANQFLRALRDNVEHVPSIDDVKIGDFALICVASFPWHIGIMSDYNCHGGLGAPFGLIHAMVQLHAVTEQRFAGVKVHSFYRLPGLD